MSSTLARRLLLSIKTIRKNYRQISVIQREFHQLNRHLSSHSANTNILHSDLPPVDLPNQSLPEFIFEKVQKWPDRIALECGVTGRKYTYAELEQKCINFSRHLRKKFKLPTGEVVAIMLPNCPEYTIAALGALLAGLVVTTINPLYKPDEIHRQLVDASARAIVTLSALHPLIIQATQKVNWQIPIIAIRSTQSEDLPKGAINWPELIENVDFVDLPAAKSDQLAFLPYSSGTTGLPKGVALTHRNLVCNINQFGGLNICLETTSDHQDVIPALLPKFHIYGFQVNGMYLLRLGCKIIELPTFTAESYLSTLRKQHPDVLLVAPPLVLFLLAHPSIKKEDFQSVRVVLSGAAPLGATDVQRLRAKVDKPIQILQGYGLTETSPAIAVTPLETNLNSGVDVGVGKLVYGTVAKFVNSDDKTDTPLPAGERGELLVKGPQVMRAYHNKPNETKEAFTADGWFRTGDIGYYNDQHYVFITDRLKELIKVKGFQVAPAELEEILRSHPDIQDAAVLGVPHPLQGEVPKAFVVLKNPKVTSNDIKDFVGEKVANYKQLHGGVQIVDSIPKSSAGKILRRVLKDMYPN